MANVHIAVPLCMGTVILSCFIVRMQMRKIISTASLTLSLYIVTQLTKIQMENLTHWLDQALWLNQNTLKTRFSRIFRKMEGELLHKGLLSKPILGPASEFGGFTFMLLVSDVMGDAGGPLLSMWSRLTTATCILDSCTVTKGKLNIQVGF